MLPLGHSVSQTHVFLFSTLNNFRHNFSTMRNKDFIFGMNTQLVKSFKMTSRRIIVTSHLYQPRIWFDMKMKGEGGIQKMYLHCMLLYFSDVKLRIKPAHNASPICRLHGHVQSAAHAPAGLWIPVYQAEVQQGRPAAVEAGTQGRRMSCYVDLCCLYNLPNPPPPFPLFSAFSREDLRLWKLGPKEDVCHNMSRSMGKPTTWSKFFISKLYFFP